MKGNSKEDMKSKIYKIGYYGFIGTVGVIAILVIISAFPIAGNYQIKVVQSGSMEPAIKTGSIVVIKPADNYEVGDVISFHGGFRLPNGEELAVTHRIVEKKVGSGGIVYKTKGDANDDPDTNEIKERQVVGKVLFNFPYVGFVVEAVRKPYGFLAIILVPAGILVHDQIAVIRKEVKKIKTKREEDSSDELQNQEKQNNQ